jgi:endo-1,4-beta-D-glucanase Y
MTEDRSYEEFMSVYLKAQELFDYNEVDQEQPLVDDSDGEYDISNMFDLYNTVERGVNVELVYTLQATDKNYVAAHVFFDSDGYGIIVWAARQPDYDPRKIK